MMEIPAHIEERKIVEEKKKYSGEICIPMHYRQLAHFQGGMRHYGYETGCLA